MNAPRPPPTKPTLRGLFDIGCWFVVLDDWFGAGARPGLLAPESRALRLQNKPVGPGTAKLFFPTARLPNHRPPVQPAASGKMAGPGHARGPPSQPPNRYAPHAVQDQLPVLLRSTPSLLCWGFAGRSWSLSATPGPKGRSSRPHQNRSSRNSPAPLGTLRPLARGTHLAVLAPIHPPTSPGSACH